MPHVSDKKLKKLEEEAKKFRIATEKNRKRQKKFQKKKK